MSKREEKDLGAEADEELGALIAGEEGRQRSTITLIASENYVFPAVYKMSGSVLTNKYSEGRVGARYYGGTEWIDKVERLCQERALALFGLDSGQWGVSVQPHSGSIANFSAYSAVIPPGGKLMGLDLSSGGHLTHGFQTKTKKVSGTSLYFTSRSYKVDMDGHIDYDALEREFKDFQPGLLICGYSAHSQDINYARLKAIAGDEAFLLADISHITALVAAGEMRSPFEHCDLVTMTTHKGLRGPRGALIFYKKRVAKKGAVHNLDAAVSSAVFPLMQGGPHNHTIAGIAYALKMAKSGRFAAYARQVVRNAQVFAAALAGMGYKVLTRGTVNHMILIDLKNKGVAGGAVEHMCDLIGVNVNKNTVPGDASPFNPSGVRIGTYAITTRGFKEEDTERLAGIFNDAVELCIEVCGGEGLSASEIDARVAGGGWAEDLRFAGLKERVANLARTFKVPGIASN